MCPRIDMRICTIRCMAVNWEKEDKQWHRGGEQNNPKYSHLAMTTCGYSSEACLTAVPIRIESVFTWFGWESSVSFSQKRAWERNRAWRLLTEFYKTKNFIICSVLFLELLIMMSGAGRH